MIEALFKDYQWGRLWHEVRNADELSYERIWRCIILVVWWQVPEQVLSELKCLHGKYKSAPLIDFAFGCVGLLKDDKVALDGCIRRLKAKQNAGWLVKWLQIERAGRSRQYGAVAQLLHNALQSGEDWAVVPVVQSLNHKNSDYSKIAHILENVSPQSDTFVALLDCVSHSRRELKFNLAKVKKNPYLAYFYSLNCSASDLSAALTYGIIAMRSGFSDPILCNIVLPIFFVADTKGDSLKKLLVELITYYSKGDVIELVDFRGKLLSYLAVVGWVQGDMKTVFDAINYSAGFYFKGENKYISDKNDRIYLLYILRIGAFWQSNQDLYKANACDNLKDVFVVGESHCLTLSNLIIRANEKSLRFRSRLIMGVKMWHLRPSVENSYKTLFLSSIKSIENHSNVMITIGEIDCRSDEGMFKYSNKVNVDINIVINETLKEYFEFLAAVFKEKDFKNIIIQGIPAPMDSQVDKLPERERVPFCQMIQTVNSKIEAFCECAGYGFVDVYSITRGPNLRSNRKAHLDDFHVSPAIYSQLFERLSTFEF